MWIVCEGRSELFVSNEMGLSPRLLLPSSRLKQRKQERSWYGDNNTSGGGMLGTITCATVLLILLSSLVWNSLIIVLYIYLINVICQHVIKILIKQCKFSPLVYCQSDIKKEWDTWSVLLWFPANNDDKKYHLQYYNSVKDTPLLVTFLFPSETKVTPSWEQTEFLPGLLWNPIWYTCLTCFCGNIFRKMKIKYLKLQWMTHESIIQSTIPVCSSSPSIMSSLFIFIEASKVTSPLFIVNSELCWSIHLSSVIIILCLSLQSPAWSNNPESDNTNRLPSRPDSQDSRVKLERRRAGSHLCWPGA